MEKLHVLAYLWYADFDIPVHRPVAVSASLETSKAELIIRNGKLTDEEKKYERKYVILPDRVKLL
jgi:hypothetical protein